MAAILRKYGESAYINFPLIDSASFDLLIFEPFPLGGFVAGDSVIVGVGNTTNIVVEAAPNNFAILLTAAELSVDQLVVVVVDQDLTKLWEDQMVCVETYGHPLAMHQFDLDSIGQAAVLGSVSG